LVDGPGGRKGFALADSLMQLARQVSRLESGQ